MFFQPKNDRQIIQLIKSRNIEDEDIAIKHLISNCKQKVIGHLRKRGERDNEQLTDLFFDATIVFIEKVRANKFELKAKICTFLTSVAERQWMDLTTRSNKLAVVEKKYLEIKESDDSKMDIDKDKMSFLISQLSANCQNLLEAYYIKDIPFIAYAEINNLNAENIRKRHQRCIDTLRALWNKN